MAEVGFFNKDTLSIKPLKKSSLVLRLMLSAFAMVCGIYVCSICLKQINFQSKSKFLGFEEFERPCYDTVVDRSQIPYLHYPKPKTFNRSECAGNPVRLFVIVSMQRSGSGWFETLLNSHRNVSSNGEIFGPKFRRNNVTAIIRTLDKVYNLDWFTSSSKNECSAAIGFKWMLNQGLIQHPKEIAEYFNDRGVSVIFLLRKNMLRRLVSMLANSFDKDAKLLNGVHVSHVHSNKEASLLSSYKPTINITSLKSDLRGMESTATKALTYLNSTRHIVLYYEDLIKDPSVVLDLDETLVCAYETSSLPAIVRNRASEAGLKWFELECISSDKECEGKPKINYVTVFERPVNGIPCIPFSAGQPHDDQLLEVFFLF